MKKITVHMTKEALFDFLMFHAYSKFSGFLVNILGFAVAFMGIILYISDKASTLNLCFYLGAAFLFLGYTPLQLKRRAAGQMKINPQYAQDVDYTFSDEGILMERGNMQETYQWSKIQKAVVTPKTIGIYYEPERALIIPKQDFGEQFTGIFQLIAMNLGASRLQMR